MNEMRKYLLICCFLLSGHYSHSQEQTIQAIRQRTDSLIQILRIEDKKERKEELIVGFYSTAIDGFPLSLLELGQKLLALSREKKDPMIETAAWSALGQGYRLTGNYARALELHQKAVALSERSGSDVIMGFAINQMGHIYKDRLENEQALKLYHAARHYGTRSGPTSLWFPLMNLGAVHLSMGQLDSALYYTNEAIRSMSVIKTQGNYVIIESTIASIYSRKGDLARAQVNFASALSRAREIQSPRYLNTCYSLLAEHYSRIEMPDSAVFFNKMATEVVLNTASNNLALKPARALIDYYQNKNADSTVKYWRIYSAANDSLNNTRANQQIQMLTLEAEQRKRDIEQARKDSRKQWQTVMLLGGLLSAILILTLMARANRRRKKDHEKLTKAYSELRSTQEQLIQSEKMASLGELTAGIAHEIQNPLNFVNNFSEVSSELISDMKDEFKKGDTEEGFAIADDIKMNLDKILHHGKRADAIVKGMLQHSRTGSGTKEPTNINALADEYLRLAYHGLKAKDNTFNATVKTDFDPSIGNVNIIPQDIGRVLLNLINNAFYAVDEKKKQMGAGYEPVVTVSTRLVSTDNSPLPAGRQESRQSVNSPIIIVSVADNGNGISEANRNKIFQPFFTTKPTGQGTGLGLSLSYDIVKAHGGEIKVESKEGEGTVFTISIPRA